MASPPPDFIFAGFFALRSPLLPFSNFVNWGQDLEGPGARGDSPSLGAALARDRVTLRRRLREVVEDAVVREALFVSSPALDDSLQHWIENPDSERGLKIERSLTRYLSRMCGRATPFGLYAGCSVGVQGQVTKLCLEPRSTYQRHTRLDMGFVYGLVENLENHPDVRRASIYRHNSSLFRGADQVRYVEGRVVGGARSYNLVGVAASEHLDTALRRCRNGATGTEIAQAICDANTEVASDDAAAFVEELIDNQIIVSDFSPPITGPEPLGQVILALRNHRALDPVTETLASVADELAAMDSAGLGVPPSRYRAVATRIETLDRPFELSRLFQVDMIKPTLQASLGPEVIQAITDAVLLLERIGQRAPDPLADFRESFGRRYETRSVPLLEVLDEDTGIGFNPSNSPATDPSPLLANLPFGSLQDGTATSRGVQRERFLMRKLVEAIGSGARELMLEEADLKYLEPERRSPLPDSFAAQVTVLASPEALARGDFRLYVQMCAGPPGAVFLGRFCHSDAQLSGHVREYLRREEEHRPEAVFAEIVHLPEGRVGNVIARPVLREYEIPFLGRSGAPLERQISLSDLTVSVVDGRVVLRSVRLGREVIPRLTNAHNFHTRGLAAYRFLGTVARQGTLGGTSFTWGAIEAPSYPRVSVGRFVLSRATWNLSKSELETFTKGSRDERYAAVQRLREKRPLPRLIYAADGDNLLAIDLDNALCVESLSHLAKGRQALRVEELLSHPGQLCVSGPEGLFAHELIVPFTKTATRELERHVMRGRSSESREPFVRCFPPGSEWLYLKVYCSPAAADRVLRALMRPLRSASLPIEQWFFIRYSDPDWHLRLRFLGNPSSLMREVLPVLTGSIAELVKAGLAWRFQLDTYERELERYGGDEALPLAERIFHADSITVLDILELLDGDEGFDARWKLALRGMDLMLDDLAFNLAAKHRLVKRLAGSFRGAKINEILKRRIGEKFRKERSSLDVLFDQEQERAHEYWPGIEALRRRSALLAPIIVDLWRVVDGGQFSGSVEDYVASLLHMYANRVLRSNGPAHEVVLYDFLARLYESQLARAKKQATPH